MKQFEICGEVVQFTDAQEYELTLFSNIYSSVFTIISASFEDKIIEYKWRKKRSETYLDEEDMCYEMEDELQKLFLTSCYGCVNLFVDSYFSAGVFDVSREELVNTAEMHLESAFEIAYRPFTDKNQCLAEYKAYNEKLRKDFYSRFKFLTELAYYVTNWFVFDLMEAYYLSDKPDIERESFNQNLSSFEDYAPCLYENKIRNVRENIKKIGFNEQNRKAYIKTFEKDPFNVNIPVR